MAYWMGLASTPADPTFFLWSDGTPPPGIDRRYAHWGKLRLADKNAPRVGRRCSCPPMRAGQWRAHCECAAKGRPSRPGRPTATLSMAGTRCRFRSPTTWPGTSTAAWPTRASRTARAGDGRTPRAAAPSPRSARSHVGALHRPPCCALHCCFFAACLPACLPACRRRPPGGSPNHLPANPLTRSLARRPAPLPSRRRLRVRVARHQHDVHLQHQHGGPEDGHQDMQQPGRPPGGIHQHRGAAGRGEVLHRRGGCSGRTGR
jgi:hypothetical protein